MEERLERQLAFALEIDKLKNILRQTHLSNAGRRENDAEHSWHMALLVAIFKEYANEEIDLGKTILLCLIHDLVEIDAGDTYAYDEEQKQSQQAREEAAKERIFSLLPPDQKAWLTSLFDEFEACQTPEARFARAMDNLQPLILNNANGGSDWKAHGVTLAQVLKRQEYTKMGSNVIYEYACDLAKGYKETGVLK